MQLQPPGEPREHRLGEVLQGRSKYKLKSYYLFLKTFKLSEVLVCTVFACLPIN